VADTDLFSQGLLDPTQPVPKLIKGQIARRYAVYRNNVTVGLIRALEANFPVLRRLLGEEYFAGFARDFAQSHPPQSPLMFQYGRALPQALETAEDLGSYPYLGDIARLEILWRESYHAADANPLAPDVLATIDTEQLFECSLKPHPATRLIQSHFAIHDIFSANTENAVHAVVDPTEAQSVLITRPHLDVQMRSVTPDQFEFFRSLLTGVRLADALDHAAVLNSNFNLSATFALMLQSGAFHSIQQDNGKTI
jgi:hypothetical protein